MNKHTASPKVSPLAPDGFPMIPGIPGVRLAAGNSAIRYQGRDDLLLVELAPDTSVAGVFTRSSMTGAPVDWCRKVLPGGRARALVVNAGIANVFTGPAGDAAVAETAKAAALAVGGRTEEVFIGSTGVIGEPLDARKIVSALPGLAAALTEDSWEAAARAIMTTDTYPKGSHRTARIGNGEVGLAGFVKGSGMIAPDMATMLGYIFTDACLPADVLQALLTQAVAGSFNCITVDSDTSTSDTILLFATGKGAVHPEVARADDPALDDFRVQLASIFLDLAHQVIRDGEGASKFITIRVNGATDDQSARRIALGVGNSPLVKTALAAGDANWGRIVMAIGKSGEPVDRSRTGVAIGGVQIAADGGVVAGYDETPVAAHMAGTDIDIDIKVGAGIGRATVWTCDLTHDYISINADYRS